LLLEIGNDDGKGCTNAVDYASLAFAANIYFRQGVQGTGMPVEYSELVANFVYEFAWRLFELTSEYRDYPASTIPFASLPFAPSVPTLPREMLMRSKRLPPLAETEYFERQGTTRFYGGYIVLND
jgi:hypothetical protein